MIRLTDAMTVHRSSSRPYRPPRWPPELPDRRSRLLVLVTIAFLLGSVALTNVADASSARTWVARVGNAGGVSGSNGTATVQLGASGSATVDLRLTGLKHAAEYALVLFQGQFMAAGSNWSARGGRCVSLRFGVVRRLAPLRTDAGGAVTRTIALPVSIATLFTSMPRRMAISVGYGTAARCGSFALQSRPPSSSAPPSPTPTPSAAPSPSGGPCDPWPTAIATILAVLSTPDGLCLRLYSDAAEAPEFVRVAGGIYFPDPPTVYYLLGSAGGNEVHVLAHEVCHAHQDRVARDEGQMPLAGWERAAAGAAYIAVTGWQDRDGEWFQPQPWGGVYTSPLEENADVCAIWFDPNFGPRYLRRDTPLRFEWAQGWLPLPSFIVPYQPVPTPEVRVEAVR
jgi:hypothetical protein